MFLDSAPSTSLPTHAGLALYRRRREDAAALWAGVPRERWGMRARQCGTIASALGWLAHKGQGGWRWSSGGNHPVGPDGQATFQGAAAYFGISLEQACKCFGSLAVNSAGFHGRTYVHQVTSADVAQALLTLPYPDKED